MKLSIKFIIIVAALLCLLALYVWYNHNRYEIRILASPAPAVAPALVYRIDTNTGKAWILGVENKWIPLSDKSN